MEITITNKDYYFDIENQIRDIFARYETEVLLPKAENVLEQYQIYDSELISFPIEGYYYNRPKLTRWFNIIRNLQSNKDIIKKVKNTFLGSPNLDRLKEVTSNPLFGPEVSPEDDLGLKPEEIILPRRRDILSSCMRNGFDTYLTHPWTVSEILGKIGKYKYGYPNLVELGYLTKDIECLACAAETNILYREIVMAFGCSMNLEPITYKWEVDSEVEVMGKRLVDAYNKLMSPRPEDMLRQTYRLEAHNLDTASFMNKNSERPRIARLGFVRLTQQHYSWAVKQDGSVVGFYSPTLYTTEMFKNHSLLLNNKDIYLENDLVNV